METSTPDSASLVMQFDNITRTYKNILNYKCEEEFLRYLSLHRETFRSQWLRKENECKRLTDKLCSALKDISVLESKLHLAKRLVDEEMMKRKKIIQERNVFCKQLNDVRRILLKDYFAELPENAKKDLVFLESPTSDYVEAESEDYKEFFDSFDKLNHTIPRAASKVLFNGPDTDPDEVLALPAKGTPTKYFSFVKDLKDRANEMVQDFSRAARGKKENSSKKSPVMSTPIRVGMNNSENSFGGIAMSPIIRTTSKTSCPSPANVSRQHNFISRTFMMPESCTRCYRKIAFGRKVLKCVNCTIVVHPECQESVLNPCKPCLNYSIIHKMELLSDYIHHPHPPLVPGIVTNCVKEIERRGLQEPRLYRMLGNKSVVNHLLAEIRCNKEESLNLVNYDTNSICRTLMKFLEHLREPLIPHVSWNVFTDAVTDTDKGSNDLMLAISSLPRINRDTLAFIILHLQNFLLESCVPVENLGVLFSNVIFGHESRDLDNAPTVVQELILLPNSYWSSVFSSSLPTSNGSPSKSDYVEKLSIYLSPMTSTPIGKKRFFNTAQ